MDHFKQLALAHGALLFLRVALELLRPESLQLGNPVSKMYVENLAVDLRIKKNSTSAPFKTTPVESIAPLRQMSVVHERTVNLATQ